MVSSASDRTASPANISAGARQLLTFLGDAIAEQYDRITKMSDAELREAVRHCEECSQTNCGWHQYAAMKFVLPELRGEIARRWRNQLVGSVA